LGFLKQRSVLGQMVKAVWGYIKAKKLNNKRMITPDATLGKVIGGKTNMFKMNKSARGAFERMDSGESIHVKSVSIGVV